MLTMTPDAAEAIRLLVDQPEAPEGAGLKLAPGVAEPGEPAPITLSLTEGPTPSDQVVEEQGARLFIDQELAPVLEDKVLDASVEGGQVAFTLIEQPPTV